MAAWFKRRCKTYGPEMILDVLEERIVLDAAVAPTVLGQADGVQNTPENVPHPSADTSGAGQTSSADHAAPDQASAVFQHDLHVVLVANSLTQIDAITQAVETGATVIVFDPVKDSLGTINAKLSDLVQTTGHKISTLVVVGHGDDGAVEIGVDCLSNGNLVKFVSGLETLGQTLTSDAQIEFYGCSVAHSADGKALIDAIASYTHATVFASTNDTGGGEGKDWGLEYSSRPTAQMVSLVDTAALAATDVTLVFSNSPYAYYDDPAGYNVYWGDIDTSDPAGTAHLGEGTSNGYAEYWTFTVPTGGGYVSFGMQTIHPENMNLTTYIDPLLRLTTPSTGMIYVDDWSGGSTMSLDNDADYDVHVWDARMINVYLPAGTYTLECTAYQRTGDDAYQSTGPYTLYSSFRPDLSSDVVPLELTYDPAHTPPNHLNNEVLSRPILNVTESTGFETYQYDVSDCFGMPPNSTIHYVLDSPGTLPSFLSALTLDPDTGILTFTESASQTAGSVNVQVHAYSGALLSGTQTFTFSSVATYDLPTADTARFTVAQNGSITFQVVGHDPDHHPLSQVRFVVDTDYWVQHGTLTAGAVTQDATDNTIYYQTFTYTPTAGSPGYYGLDGFQFTFQTQGGTTWNGFNAGLDGNGKPVGVSMLDAYETYAIQVADLNNDGLLDIVEGNSGDPNRYYLNDGKGNFSVGYALDTSAYDTRSLALADVNRDGYVDIVVGNTGEADRVYLNLGAPLGYPWQKFDAGHDIPGTASADEYAVVLGDLNGDGYVDLVRGIGNWPGTTRDYVHLNDGKGNFGPGTAIPTTHGGYTRALALGDLDRDGNLDLVVGKYDNYTDIVFYGNGDGTFGSETALPGDDDATVSVALGDVNGDGWLDIATGNYNQRPRLYLNDTSGDFDDEDTISNNRYYTYGIALVDIDRDGDLDAVTGNHTDNDQEEFSRYYLNDGTGDFDSAGNVETVGYDTRAIAVADLNGDHAPDVVLGIDDAADRIFYNRGFTTGTGTWHTSGTAQVDLNVALLTNPSFGQDATSTAPGYSGWNMWEGSSIDPFGSAFGVIRNNSTIPFWDVINNPTTTTIHDYYDNADEGQISFGLPWTINDRAADNHEYFAVLLGNFPHDAHIAQTVTLPQASAGSSVDLHWRMAYQDVYSFVDPATPFDANQFIAVYIYDGSQPRPANPTPVWISTADATHRDTGIVYSLQDYCIHVPAALLPIGHSQSVTVEFEVMAQGWFFQVALDDVYFQQIPSGTAPPPPPQTEAAVLSFVVTPLTETTSSLAFVSSAPLASLTTAPATMPVMTVLDVISSASAPSLSAPLTTLDSEWSTFSTSPSPVDEDLSSVRAYSWTVEDVTAAAPVKPVAHLDSAPTSQDLFWLLDGASVTPMQPDQSQVVPDLSGHAVDVVPDSTAADSDVVGKLGQGYDPHFALVLDLADVSALHVLEAQAQGLGLHGTASLRDLGARLSAGESVVFAMDSIRLTEL